MNYDLSVLWGKLVNDVSSGVKDKIKGRIKTQDSSSIIFTTLGADYKIQITKVEKR